MDQKQEAEGKYLYCIVKKRDFLKPEIRGIEGKDVYGIYEGKFAAAVSDSEVKEYFITRENLLAHQKVIEEIRKKCDVLPVSFGTVIVNSRELKKKLLKAQTKDFSALFERVGGKIELGLKALWPNINLIFKEIRDGSPTIQKLKKTRNLNYQDKISVGKLVSDLLEETRETAKEEILKPLRKIADDTEENKIFGDNMILNAAFLVKKEKEEEFDEALNLLGKKYGQRIKFMYIGPLPPFNFVKFSL